MIVTRKGVKVKVIEPKPTEYEPVEPYGSRYWLGSAYTVPTRSETSLTSNRHSTDYPATILPPIVAETMGGIMSVAQRINDFITQQHSNPVCNKCIAIGLNLTNDAAHPAQITGALATTSDFVQEREECSLCKNTKKVIRKV